jgi:hypothetical protein
VALVLGQGGPGLATLTCLATVAVAAVAGTGAAAMLDRIIAHGKAAIEDRTHRP